MKGGKLTDEQYKLKAGAQASTGVPSAAAALGQGLLTRASCWQFLMITFQIAGYLTEFTGGDAEIVLDGSVATVGEALNQLWNRHVGLRDRVVTERGEVRPHVNVFVNGQVVRRDQVLQIPIESDTEICIMPAVSGGAEARASARAQKDFGRNNMHATSV